MCQVCTHETRVLSGRIPYVTTFFFFQVTTWLTGECDLYDGQGVWDDQRVDVPLVPLAQHQREGEHRQQAQQEQRVVAYQRDQEPGNMF